ncbi:MAG TPA: GGDEF domain-containing protein [Rudaea sp.]
MSKRHEDYKTDRTAPVHRTNLRGGSQPPRLVVVSGLMLGHQIELGNSEVVVGRTNDCTISLPHPSVSRRHCRIWREDGRYLIEDLGSTNRTYLNGDAVQRAELRDGDQIGIGNNAIKFFVGTSLEANYHHELIDLAICDSLTGFFNRRHFRMVLDEEIGKNRGGLSLLMLDLDHFKAFNDAHGHLVGDQVLGAVAQIIREHTPPGVPIGRLGGEEFAILLVGSGLEMACEVAEAVRKAVAARAIAVRELSLPVTVSIGVAQLGTPDSASLLRTADEHLYRAKQEGRNRVAF